MYSISVNDLICHWNSRFCSFIICRSYFLNWNCCSLLISVLKTCVYVYKISCEFIYFFAWKIWCLYPLFMKNQMLRVCVNSKVKLRDIFKSFEDVDDDGEVDEFENICDIISNMDTPQPSASAGRNFAETANKCFMRINRNLRTFLRRNRFPAGELQHLEEELVAFFVEWPSSVYVAQLPDGYRRLMLHAVSQYLDLDAHSFDIPGCRVRQTHVENNRGKGDTFSPPPTPLAAFIQDKKFACPVQVWQSMDWITISADYLRLVVWNRCIPGVPVVLEWPQWYFRGCTVIWATNHLGNRRLGDKTFGRQMFGRHCGRQVIIWPNV